MNPCDKAKQLERKAKEAREREAEENREKFPILNDPTLRELVDCFNGRVVYVSNAKGEWKGKK